MEQTVRKSPEGLAYLNIGCGDLFSREWNNLDLSQHEYVSPHDLRQPLPYPAEVFDAVYGSHILEHLTPAQGKSLAEEIYRVLVKGGVSRLVVPDLEQICRDYLQQLTACLSEPSLINLRRYKWVTLELLDQMVREKTGGLMVEVLGKGDFDRDFVQARAGDEFLPLLEHAVSREQRAAERKGHPLKKILAKAPGGQALLKAATSLLRPPTDPRQTGEAHKWMYDRLSLKFLLEETGFVNFSLKSFAESSIPYWERYNLDKSGFGNSPRKPNSLYAECQKPR